MQNFHGSCHCGVIRFKAGIDLSAGTLRCNCSFCLKVRCWAVRVKPAEFHVLAGATDLTEYQFGARRERHFFCRHCGVRPFGSGVSARFGLFYSVSVTCLDDVTTAELANAPITYIDGENDLWDTPPDITGYL